MSLALLSMDEETPEQTIRRLELELDHVGEQSRVSHRMFVYYKGEYDKAERLRARMERSLNTWRSKLLGMPKGQKPTEAELDLWAAEAENPDQVSL